MSETQTIAPADVKSVAVVLSTPSDGETPAPIKKERKRRRGFRLFDDGGGDFRIYEVIPPGDKRGLQGALAPIVEFGGYESAVAAKKALRASGAEKLQGKTVIILRGIEIVRIVVETKPRIVIESKPRRQVTGPTEAQAG